MENYMIITNYPFKPMTASYLTDEILKEVMADWNDVYAFVTSGDMKKWDAASIYYFACKRFPRREEN